jgi:hypothetical protein
MDSAHPNWLRFDMRAVVDNLLVIGSVLVLLSLLWQ